MKVFVSYDFTGHWPVGAAAVILADDDVQAKFYLRQALKACGLGEQTDFTVAELVAPGAHILHDGNY